MPTRTRKIIISLFLVFLLLVGVVIFFGSKETGPQIIQVFPEPGSQEVKPDEVISLIFGETPPIENLSFKIEPETPFKQEVYDQSLILSPETNLRSKATYRVVVFFKDKEILSWRFTTKILFESETIESETRETQRLYPLITYLPLETALYHLTYANPLVLQVTLKTEDRTAAETEIKTWMKTKGVDPATHEFVFIPEL